MHSTKRTILFVTERRADYSRLKPIMRAVQRSKKLRLQIAATGGHLLKDYGETRRIIERDGFKITATLPMFTTHDSDDGVAMVKGLGRTLIAMGGVFAKLKPDIIFCGFDLDAHLAAAITGLHLNIHVAHLQGGEVSGTIDEMLRHACTKLAHLHFAATAQSVKRIIKLGEDPRYVFKVGSPSLDTIHSISYLPKPAICSRYGLNSAKRLAIFLQHSVTTEVNNVERQIGESLSALKYCRKKFDLEVIAIYSNNDAGGKRIVRALERSGFIVWSHIPYEDFLRLLKVATVLVGNSSTAIHEAPSYGLPAVNIGSRQQHRERGINIIDVKNQSRAIISGITCALSDAIFIRRAKHGKNPYDQGNTARRVIKILENIRLPPIQKVITY